jgi:hypothetical protein
MENIDRCHMSEKGKSRRKNARHQVPLKQNEGREIEQRKNLGEEGEYCGK